MAYEPPLLCRMNRFYWGWGVVFNLLISTKRTTTHGFLTLRISWREGAFPAVHLPSKKGTRLHFLQDNKIVQGHIAGNCTLQERFRGEESRARVCEGPCRTPLLTCLPCRSASPNLNSVNALFNSREIVLASPCFRATNSLQKTKESEKKLEYLYDVFLCSTAPYLEHCYNKQWIRYFMWSVTQLQLAKNKSKTSRSTSAITFSSVLERLSYGTASPLPPSPKYRVLLKIGLWSCPF